MPLTATLMYMPVPAGEKNFLPTRPLPALWELATTAVSVGQPSFKRLSATSFVEGTLSYKNRGYSPETEEIMSARGARQRRSRYPFPVLLSISYPRARRVRTALFTAAREIRSSFAIS